MLSGEPSGRPVRRAGTKPAGPQAAAIGPSPTGEGRQSGAHRRRQAGRGRRHRAAAAVLRDEQNQTTGEYREIYEVRV